MDKVKNICCGEKMRKRWAVAGVLYPGFHLLMLVPFGWPLLNFIFPIFAIKEYCMIMEGILLNVHEGKTQKNFSALHYELIQNLNN